MRILTAILTVSLSAIAGFVFAGDIALKPVSEEIYVPAYSMVLIDPKTSHQMAITVVVHNTDPEQSITLQKVDHYDYQGHLVKSLIDEKIEIPPFGSWKYLVDIRDRTGGLGANFIVEWASDFPANSPIVETLMIGGSGTQGISFASRGKVISRVLRNASNN